MGEYTTFFVAVGMFAVLIIIASATYFLGVFSYYSFKKWRRNKCKFKCLCKHTYEIQWIDGHYDMMIMCKTCGKAKELHFSGESLEVFGFKFKC